MAEASDPDILAWAAAQNRVLLTHDILFIFIQAQRIRPHVYA
jgi:predicted nuclease of predicted toxin-antitoxin system